jgi:hypothetical protein
MIAMRETIETGLPMIWNDPAGALLGDEERAELTWGDGALTIAGDVSVTPGEGFWAIP